MKELIVSPKEFSEIREKALLTMDDEKSYAPMDWFSRWMLSRFPGRGLELFQETKVVVDWSQS